MARPLQLTPGNAIEWRWAGVFLLVSALLGLSTLVLPVHYVIIGLIGIAVLAYLALNPDKAYFLTILTIPFTDRVRVLPVSFSLNEIILVYCVAFAFVQMILRGYKISFRTGLDGWILLLSGMFFLAGFFSESNTGLLGFFKILEGYVFYYLTIYFLRTKQMTRSGILKVVFLTALSQAILGIFQSFTGIGADFQSQRGYLGYLGLGSSTVWHGRGTTWHFNTLGNYLVVNVVAFLPLYFFCVKRKKWAGFLLGLLLLGILTTYSRGSLLGLAAGVIFLLALSQPTLKRGLMFAGGFVLAAIVPALLIFGNSDYVNTVSYNERLIVWQVPLAAIHSSAKAFWLGSGINSYQVVAWPFMPAWVPADQYRNWFAHNFYLLTMIEVGLVGCLVFFSFLAYLLIDAWRKYKQWHGFAGVYALGISGAIMSIFFVSIFDHTFGAPHFKMFLFMLLGLLYVKRRPATRERELEFR